METKQKKTETDWKKMLQGLANNVLEHAGDSLARKLHAWVTKFKRRAIGSVFLAVGIIFFLNSIALYINAMTQNLLPWLGYSAVGLVTIFAGYVMLKE